MGTFTVEHDVDMGVAGNVTISVEVDPTDHMSSAEFAELAGVADVVTYNGEEEVLDHLSFDAIAEYTTSNDDVLKRVIRILGDKYEAE